MWTIGLDRSLNLLEIAQNAGDIRREVVWGNVLDRLWRAGAFVRSALCSFKLGSNSTYEFTGLYNLNRHHPPSINSRKKKDRSAGVNQC